MMTSSLATLRAFVKLTLDESTTLPRVWFHGSPYCCMETAADYERPIMFVTDSEAVAREYRWALPAAARRPKGNHRDEPTLYKVRLLFSSAAILDTRVPAHRAVYQEIADGSTARRIDPQLVSVHAARDSTVAGAFPSYGTVLPLMRALEPMGFQAAFIAEGTQGASLAVWRPQQAVEIISRTPM